MKAKKLKFHFKEPMTSNQNARLTTNYIWVDRARIKIFTLHCIIANEATRTLSVAKDQYLSGLISHFFELNIKKNLHCNFAVEMKRKTEINFHYLQFEVSKQRIQNAFYLVDTKNVQPN